MAEETRLPALSPFFEKALLSDGWRRNVRLSVQGGKITEISADCRPSPEDEAHSIGLPGMANVHSHGFQRGLAGRAEFRGGSDSFWTWRDVMYRFVTAISPDDVEALSALAFAEMLEGGFTRVGEFHYVHNDPAGKNYANIGEMSERIAAAAGLSGIGLTLLPVFYERGGFDGRAPNPAQRRFCLPMEKFAALLDASAKAIQPLDGAILGLAPHSLRAVSPTSLARLVPLMKDRPIHIHIAEQQREVDDCERALAARPVRWLLDNMPVDSRWCLIHATHTDENEIMALARSGAVAGLCPISEANLGDGLFPLPDYLAQDGHFGIGSDANTFLSVAEELRLLEYGQRLARQSRNIAASDRQPSTGRTLFETAVAGGAQALGIAAGFMLGAPADILALDGGHEIFANCPDDRILDCLIFAGSARLITEVWRGGRKFVHKGRHIRKEAIVSRYLRTVSKLLSP